MDYYKKFPKYFDVDDIPVKLYLNPKDNKVYAVNDLGNPADMGKAIVEGRKISRAEFIRFAKARAIELGITRPVEGDQTDKH